MSSCRTWATGASTWRLPDPRRARGGIVAIVCPADGAGGARALPGEDVVEVRDVLDDLVASDVLVRHHPAEPPATTDLDEVLTRLGYLRDGPWRLWDIDIAIEERGTHIFCWVQPASGGLG